MDKKSKGKIDLPGYSWFYSNQQGTWVKNSYSGSRGTSTTNGCLCNKTYNYRVYIKDISETESVIIAECYFIFPIEQGGNKTEVVSNKFENSEKGLIDASFWLYEEEQKGMNA